MSIVQACPLHSGFFLLPFLIIIKEESCIWNLLWHFYFKPSNFKISVWSQNCKSLYKTTLESMQIQFCMFVDSQEWPLLFDGNWSGGLLIFDLFYLLEKGQPPQTKRVLKRLANSFNDGHTATPLPHMKICHLAIKNILLFTPENKFIALHNIYTYLCIYITMV